MIRFSGLDRGAPRQAVAVATRTVLACPPEVQRAFGTMLWSLDLRDAVPALTVPTHVLVGATDRLTPPWHAYRIARALPDCTGVTVLPRVGHMTPVESPGAVARRLRALAGLVSPPGPGKRAPPPPPASSARC